MPHIKNRSGIIRENVGNHTSSTGNWGVELGEGVKKKTRSYEKTHIRTEQEENRNVLTSRTGNL